MPPPSRGICVFGASSLDRWFSMADSPKRPLFQNTVRCFVFHWAMPHTGAPHHFCAIFFWGGRGSFCRIWVGDSYICNLH